MSTDACLGVAPGSLLQRALQTACNLVTVLESYRTEKQPEGMPPCAPVLAKSRTESGALCFEKRNYMHTEHTHKHTRARKHANKYTYTSIKVHVYIYICIWLYAYTVAPCDPFKPSCRLLFFCFRVSVPVVFQKRYLNMPSQMLLYWHNLTL